MGLRYLRWVCTAIRWVLYTLGVSVRLVGGSAIPEVGLYGYKVGLRYLRWVCTASRWVCDTRGWSVRLVGGFVLPEVGLYGY